MKRKIDEEKKELDSEMKSPFAGLKEILSGGDKTEVEEPADKRGAAMRYPRGQRPPSSGPPVRGPKAKAAPDRPAKRPPRKGRGKDEDVKAELERETSKLESFLADILSSSSSSDSAAKQEDSKGVTRRGPKTASPPTRPSLSQSPSKTSERSSPGRPPVRKPKGLSDDDIKQELKKMEEDMDKEIKALFKR